jgi:hypothetical protein
MAGSRRTSDVYDASCAIEQKRRMREAERDLPFSEKLKILDSLLTPIPELKPRPARRRKKARGT